ncbi:acetyl-CoA/propionyl-CoA carboxylase [Capronia epimyces CBS 606.96]|uniref:Acetyl-CoA/propionyl-CoA carboxylase n=1 Tax=Capronia epimyces CBS 606.96 TaxID=1182542 RepID=W9YIC9_9EURO|nr:acetyl-CoA/propionyl-CoA carboxylase [Capronia epimyces CBS 606.96]EXJ89400.1 acetyl-CoA/propionyl-CoA carboxylase [Capronia epimyces CBS 606.96]
MEGLKTLLVANRGEIACRLIKAAKELNIRVITIYSETDSASLHVMLADKACLLKGDARTAYLDGSQIIEIAKTNVVQAIVPGYGFLSENRQFAAAVEAASMVFVGPSPQTIEAFGLKHIARDLAIKAGVPVVPGTEGLLDTEAAAIDSARQIGYPVMLKATAGGGGMGLMVCNDEQDVHRHFRAVKSRGDTLFKNSGVFIERYFAASHHIEVQIFGNGHGKVISIGERECSIQRRHQKVIEECPSPFVVSRHPELRTKLTECAIGLAASVNYRSAGTVEYLVDDETGDFFFLEMNTRLQVEHGITEMCYNVDLVQLMYQQANGQLLGKGGIGVQELDRLQNRLLSPRGHAIEARVYAENAARDFAPATGLLQQVDWHILPGTRIDSWIRAGNTVGHEYDPMLAKVIQFASTRDEAIAALDTVLSRSDICGPVTNLGFLRSIIQQGRFKAGDTTTAFLSNFRYRPTAIDVISGGSQTLVQDFPGRPSVGHGFGHSGPMDPIAFQIANALVGNPLGTEGLEITISGPELLFISPAVIALCGPPVHAALDGQEVPLWTRLDIAAGQRLRIGQIMTGCRVYMAVYGGFPRIAKWFGSKATNPGVSAGGYQGRALRSGDLLEVTGAENLPELGCARSLNIPKSLWPRYSHHWNLLAIPGPYETGYLTAEDIDMLYSQTWKISHNAARGGIRLIGPGPEFARADGGDGGSHPSNVIEYGYPIGGLNWTGGEAVLLPVDSPDFGGFICSLTVVKCDWWKMGQMRPGDSVRFHRANLSTALSCRRRNEDFIANIVTSLKSGAWDLVTGIDDAAPDSESYSEGADIVKIIEETAHRPRVTYRAGGDSFLLVDYGVGKADLNLKCRATTLKRSFETGQNVGSLKTTGGEGAVLNMVTCGNSLMIHFDSLRLAREDLVSRLVELEESLGSMMNSTIPHRRFRLPIVFSHQKLEDTIHRYTVNQRSSAPYLPDPFHFMAENNGITVQELKALLLNLEAVVIGVGFLMALPQCIPADPRHRLNVPKMTPSRVFTPGGTVAWGGNAIAIYTQDSPGGYMPAGLTIPGVDMYGYKAGFSRDRPWMFEDMDMITFYEVDPQTYDVKMAEFISGNYQFEYVDGVFSLADHNKLLDAVGEEAKELDATRAVAQQRMATLEKDSFEKWVGEKKTREAGINHAELLSGGDPNVEVIEAPTNANVWKVTSANGQILKAEQSIITLEAMKMEIQVSVPDRLDSATLERLLVAPGDIVESGQALAIVRLPKKK